MKNFRIFAGFSILVLFSVLFMGCPISTEYPLGESGVTPIDKKLIGTWRNDSTNVEVMKAEISKRDDYRYNIKVLEKGSMFMDEGEDYIGWITVINDQRFLVAQKTKGGSPSENYYVYHILLKGKELISHDISLKVGGVDAVKSIETYLEEVKASMSKEGFLSSEIHWRRQ